MEARLWGIRSHKIARIIFLYLCVGEGLTKRYWPENTEKKKKGPPNDPERFPRLKVLWAFIHFAAIIFCT